MPAFPLRSRRRGGGFTLVELMIATTIGLLILAGMASLFVSNGRTQAEIEKANRQVENGRYGIEVLSTDLSNSGFYGEFDPTSLVDPGSLPLPCATALDALREALALPVQGLDNADASAALPCLSDRKAGSDVLVVRRVETCLPGVGNCADTASGGAFLQASTCSNLLELGAGDPSKWFDLDTDLTKLTRKGRDCSDDGATGSPGTIRRYLVHIYYVATSDNSGDGIPTLKRAELTTSGTGLVFNVVPLVEGIQDMQLEYGSGNGVFSSSPASVQDWRKVVAVKMYLLARNLDESRDYTDTKSYTLGISGTTANVVAAANDHYKRHVFQSQVVLRNPAGRIAP